MCGLRTATRRQASSKKRAQGEGGAAPPECCEGAAGASRRMADRFRPGGKVLPLAERQVMVLRDENKTYRAKLAELIQFGEENVAISDKMHRLAVAMLPAPDLDGLLSAFYYNLREDFAVPHTAIRLWREGADAPAGRAEFGAASAALREYAQGLAHPYCGPSANVEAAAWFGDAASHVRSVAHVALCEPGPGRHDLPQGRGTRVGPFRPQPGVCHAGQPQGVSGFVEGWPPGVELR